MSPTIRIPSIPGNVFAPKNTRKSQLCSSFYRHGAIDRLYLDVALSVDVVTNDWMSGFVEAAEFEGNIVISPR